MSIPIFITGYVANDTAADYIAFGPIFKTKAKDYYLGTKDIKKCLKVSGKPVFFIGGITISNIDEVLKEGAKNVAVIRGITEEDDMESAARNFKKKLKEGD